MALFGFWKKNEPKVNTNLLAIVQSLARNEILMNVCKVNCSIDGSKIGGKPYLPFNFQWPVFFDSEEGVTRPLSFFCQIDLEEVAAYDKDHKLPRTGMLSFFYDCAAFRWGFDPEDRDAAQVFYFEKTEGFVPTELPENLQEEYHIPEMRIGFSARNSYPKYEEFSIHSDLDCEWEEYDLVLEKLGVDLNEDPQDHKLLGYADIIQDEMLSECERVYRGMYCGDAESYQQTSEEECEDIAEKAKEWTLLLQLSTIETDEFEWMFGDCGMLYFYIRRQDLEEKRFDNCRFAMQCG